MLNPYIDVVSSIVPTSTQGETRNKMNKINEYLVN